MQKKEKLMSLCSEIYFLRHLKTINNDLQIISGQSDSNIVCKDLTIPLEPCKFDKIYCSPSSRCKETLAFFKEKIASAHDIVFDKHLLERHMGDFEGMRKEKVALMYPDFFIDGMFDVFKTPPKGESYDCFKERVENFYNKYISNDCKILICSHNQTLKMLRLLILKKRVTHEEWKRYSFKNGELVKIR